MLSGLFNSSSTLGQLRASQDDRCNLRSSLDDWKYGGCKNCTERFHCTLRPLRCESQSFHLSSVVGDVASGVTKCSQLFLFFICGGDRFFFSIFFNSHRTSTGRWHQIAYCQLVLSIASWLSARSLWMEAVHFIESLLDAVCKPSHRFIEAVECSVQSIHFNVHHCQQLQALGGKFMWDTV